MSNIVVDDTDASLTYSGQWNLFANGSSRQWDSTVHSTFQYGATASFGFRGSVCKVYGTVPPGNGSTILIDVTIDGSVSPIISATSGSAAVYANLFYQSSAMESNWHTVIITNRGSAGNLDFEFDRVELDANDILPTVTPISLASTTAVVSPSSQTSPSSASSNSQLSKAATQSTTVPSSVLTQIVTTTRQDGSVATSEVTLFPTATSQASSNSTHPIPVGTVIGIVGGIIALFLLLFLYYRRRKAINHRFALMGLGSNNVTQNMSQNPTTVATPFTLRPLPSSSTDLNVTHYSSRPPLFSTMSEKALRQQSPANRPETDLQATSIPSDPDLSHSLNVPAVSVSVPNEPLASDSSPPTGPQVPPEPNQAAANNDAAYHLQYLSGYMVGPSPPAYRPNNE